MKVPQRLNGKHLSLRPEMSGVLDQSPSCKSSLWFVTMPSPVTPEDPTGGAVFSACTCINSISKFILWLKRKASWRQCINNEQIPFYISWIYRNPEPLPGETMIWTAQLETSEAGSTRERLAYSLCSFIAVLESQEQHYFRPQISCSAILGHVEKSTWSQWL